MSDKGRKLKEASTSNCHLRQSSRDHDDIQQISDAIHIFYEPQPADNATLDIFFFHGLECEFEGAHVRDAHVSSWKSTGEPEQIWPRKWLPDDFPQARIMSICYDCCMTQTDTEGRFELYLLAENLLQEITWAREGRGYTPLVLVGHGFGGIVMKTICVQAQRSISNKDMDMFLESVRGFFFYATPHLGIQGMEPSAGNEGPLVKWMRELNSESARLNEDFTKLWIARRYRWTIFGVGEVESTLGKQGIRVPEASARFGDDKYITVSGDHFSVCRPSDKHSNKYQHLTNLIRDIQHQAEVERKPPLLVPEETVGVDSLITEILGKHMRDHRFVGFSGMGGVGKTTLAKFIFNKICARFEFSCFVEEIKQFLGTKDEVRRKIWEKMRCNGVPFRSSSGSFGGGDHEWSQVAGKSLFLVFDDVEDPNHVTLLKEIAQENGMEESRFVLTSRNAQRLVDCGYDVHTIRVDVLGSQDAQKLFITYAFPGQEEPPERFRGIVEQVVDGCEGLPLTLEVLGKYLRDKKFELWAEIPAALRKCDEVADLEEKVWFKLRLSYDGLPSNEVKNMFLDTASFFILANPGYIRTRKGTFSGSAFLADDAIMAWSAIYGGIVHSRLQILEDRALVTIRRWKDDYGNDRKEFYMHEHLRRMGQRIACLEGRSFELSRIWSLSTSSVNSKEEDYNSYPYDDQVVFQGDQELGNIVAHRVRISMNSLRICGQTCAFCVMRKVWPRLTAIRYMQLVVGVSECCECKDRKVALPSTLVLFSLDFIGDFNFSAEVGRDYIDGTRRTVSLSLIRCDSLVKLDLSSCNSVDLGGLNELRLMRDLSISECNAVRNWPESLGELRNLERLELVSIRERFHLPTTVGDLPNLQHLKIVNCEIISIPRSLRKLTSLQSLQVDEIIGRQTIPNVIGSLRQLQVLRMKCWAIADLVDAVRELVALRKLRLECEGMLELPDTFGNMTNLKELALTCHIRSLPTSFSNLKRLEEVALYGVFVSVIKRWHDKECRVEIRTDDDKTVRDVLHHLQGFMTKQKKLELRCTSGPAAGLSVKNMINLESLVITVDCRLSQSSRDAIPDIFGTLQNLRSFELKCCAVEESLVRSLGCLSSLEKLHLMCETVEQLPPVFGCFSTLKTLRIVCPSLQALPVTIGNFIQLRKVQIRDTGLRSFPGSLAKLSSLQSLSLWDLQKLETLPEGLESLHFLQKLKIRRCAVESLPGSLGRLSSLTHLWICSCENLKILPETIGDLSRLTTLDLAESALHSLPESLGRLSALRVLNIDDCTSLTSLPETIGNLSSLDSLLVAGSALHFLPESLDQLSALRVLLIDDCRCLTSLPETVGNLSSLKSLSLSGSALHSLPESLGQLSALRVLRMDDCKSLTSLPETIGNLSSLKSLGLSGSALHSLPESLGRLSSLTFLDLSSCENLQTLPLSLAQLSCLTRLVINDYLYLETLPETIRNLSSLESL